MTEVYLKESETLNKSWPTFFSFLFKFDWKRKRLRKHLAAEGKAGDTGKLNLKKYKIQ